MKSQEHTLLSCLRRISWDEFVERMDEIHPVFHTSCAFGVKFCSRQNFRTEASHEYLSATLFKKTNKVMN